MIRKEGLALEYADDELVIVEKQSGQVHQLNSTATLVWRGLDEELAVGEIAAKLADRFDVDLKTAEVDVAEIISQLREVSLLTAEESETT